ncbi:MAG: isopenicillin N synthase family oxygenase, partial [Acinetobacter guillouiae]
KDQPAQYAPLKGGEHLFNQTAQTFQYLKEKVARGDIQLENARPLYSFGLSQNEESL